MRSKVRARDLYSDHSTYSNLLPKTISHLLSLDFGYKSKQPKNPDSTFHKLGTGT
jgi:hypothetical protein